MATREANDPLLVRPPKKCGLFRVPLVVLDQCPHCRGGTLVGYDQ